MTNIDSVLQELAELRDRLLDTIGNDYARDVENIMAMISAVERPAHEPAPHQLHELLNGEAEWRFHQRCECGRCQQIVADALRARRAE